MHEKDNIYELLRHLQNIHIEEITELLKKAKMNDRISFIHYPNQDYYNILHIHICLLRMRQSHMHKNSHPIPILNPHTLLLFKRNAFVLTILLLVYCWVYKVRNKILQFIHMNNT